MTTFTSSYYNRSARQNAQRGYGDTDLRPSFNAAAERKMASKFPGTCRSCGARFDAGTMILWSKAGGSKHVECPKAVESVAAKSAQDDNADEIAMREMEAAADRAGTERDNRSKAQARAAMEMSVEDQADALLNEFEAVNRKRNLENTRKAIYRVSLNGQEGRYITDHVNIALVPNEKYHSVKISDYNGDSIGVIRQDGSIRLWDGVEADSAHTKAVLAGLDILLGSADPKKFAEAFAVEAESCMRCGRPLVDDKSRARLLGPECASKWE